MIISSQLNSTATYSLDANSCSPREKSTKVKNQIKHNARCYLIPPAWLLPCAVVAKTATRCCTCIISPSVGLIQHGKVSITPLKKEDKIAAHTIVCLASKAEQISRQPREVLSPFGCADVSRLGPGLCALLQHYYCPLLPPLGTLKDGQCGTGMRGDAR